MTLNLGTAGHNEAFTLPYDALTRTFAFMGIVGS